MQKLPEASDRKKGRRMLKRKGTSDKRRKIILFQQCPANWQHLNLPTASGSQRGCSKVPCWANLSLVALVSVNSMPKYKSYKMGLSKLQTKTLDLDKLLKATNTLLKLWKTKWECSYTKKQYTYFETLWLGDSTISIVFRENSLTHWMVCWTQEMKEK